MTDLLLALFRCSLSMSLITLVYAALMPALSKRYAAKWRYTGWLVIAAGWIIPLRPRIDLFLPRMTPLAPLVWSTAKVPSMAAMGSGASSPAAIPLWPALTAMWILGLAGVLVYHALRHGRFMNMVRRWSEPVSDPESLKVLDSLKGEMEIKAEVDLKVCRSITSPMLTGFFRPVILLPPVKIADDELFLILKHELIHFQRHDLWHKALVLAATALHWFNPLVYLMAQAVAAHCEISCDELVLQGADFQRRRRYGETIIGIVRNGAKPRTVLSTNFYGGKRNMKNRIASIMDTKRKKTGMVIFCIILAGITTTGAVFAVPTPDGRTVIVGITNNRTGQVSVDGGQTWMDEEAYQKLYPAPNVVWWTYNDYREFVTEQKRILPGLIGETYGYYDREGVLRREVWTREKIREAIRRYEQILEDIKNGALVSRSIEANEQYGSNHRVTVSTSTAIMVRTRPVSVGYTAALSFGNGDIKYFNSYTTKEELFAAVKAFCDKQVKAGEMTQQEADRIADEMLR
jgi:beta-lactamase regulating signal transducer with metallopeptidase domain